MKKKAGTQQNLMRIIRLLRHSMPMTRQEIAGELDLSMPTALGNIEELSGIILVKLLQHIHFKAA